MKSRSMRAAQTSGADRRMPLVVCVDDDPAVLGSLRRLFRNEPYHLLTTGSPEEVLKWVEDRPVDLVLTDQRMPTMSGIDLAAAVALRAPGTLFVILTGYPDSQVILERTRLRIGRLLTKPWNDEDLRRSVRTLLAQSRRPAPPAAPLRRSGRGGGPGGKRRGQTHIRIDCTGLMAGDVLGAILTRCRHVSRGGRVRVLLDHLVRVEGSLAHFLKETLQRVAGAGLPVDLDDEAGCITAFRQAMWRDIA